ncbi:MAG: glycosyltransferase [Proteobacteria bacterium]|nr:glycosyltransferase [Pseudomonadota bacterium]
MLLKGSSRSTVYFDCRQLGGSGIGTYVENLIRNFYGMVPDYPLQILARKEHISEIERFSHFKIKKYNDPIYSIAEQFKWLTKVDPFGLLHVPHYNAPLIFPGRLIVTVHDVCHLAMKQYFPGMLKGIYSGPFLQRVLKKADYIITVSSFSKSEILKHFDIPADKITVIHLGVDSIFHPISKVESQIVLQKHGLPNDYFLFVGNIKPHKNIAGLISSYKLASSRNPDLPPLVILGQHTDLKTDIPNIDNLLSDEQLKRKIVFTGSLPTEDLPAIYSRASLFLFPSFYEGFGLPTLEAMACGTPVITSNCSSLPEVVDDSAMLVDPYNHEEIAESILLLANDTQLQEEYRKKGFAQIKKFSWQTSAQKHLDIYSRARRSASPLSFRPTPYSATEKKKLNILFLEQYGDRIGGGQVILLDILEKFQSSGLWNVFISVPNEGKFTDTLKKRNLPYYCIPSWKPSSNIGVTVYDMLNYVASSIKSTYYLSQKVNGDKIDVIYCNGGRTFLNGAFLSLLFPVKIFFHLHLILEHGQKRAVTILGRTFGVKSIIAVSNTLETQYRDHAIHKKIKIIANWVSPIFFQVPLIERDKILKPTLRIGVVGLITKSKGQWTILESLNKLNEVLPIRLSIFGDPEPSEQEDWDTLKSKISSLCEKGWDIRNVGFVGNTIEIYDNLDILIIPSIAPEAFGLTAIEAMAREVMVISNKTGALLEIIKHKQNGLLYDVNNLEELPNLLKQVLANEYDIVSIRNAGMETVRKLYHPEKQLDKLYDMVCNEVVDH